MPYVPPKTPRGGSKYLWIDGPNDQEQPDDFSTDNKSGVFNGTLFDMSGEPLVQFRGNNLWFGTFDFSNCIDLLRAEIGNNSGTSFDFSGCVSLERLQVTAGGPINLSGCVSLEKLALFGSAYAPIDISDLVALRALFLNTNGSLTTLDASANINLEVLHCGGGLALSSLTLPGTSALTDLQVYNQALTSVSLTGCTGLTNIDVGDNPSLASLDISPCSGLLTLYMYGLSSFTSLTMTGITTLTVVDFTDTPITSFTFTAQPNLTDAYFSQSSIQSINLTGLSNLQVLDANSIAGGITSLTLSGNTALNRIEVDSNGLTTFPSLTAAPALVYLRASGNAFPQSVVDQILADLDANGLSDGNIYLDGGTSATPSAAGLVSSSNLQGKGWGVVHN